ncbi:MAG TPA: hypothetical protein ENI76_10005 [Ignavibacteria bacterium]|nr:hypothetical protein [Ignavibacteria bacterium]
MHVIKAEHKIINGKLKHNFYSSHLKDVLQNYFLSPILSGFYGFALFFSTVIFAKGLGTLVGSIPQFNINIGDAELSIIGFVFLFLIRFLKNYTPDAKKE